MSLLTLVVVVSVVTVTAGVGAWLVWPSPTRPPRRHCVAVIGTDRFDPSPADIAAGLEAVMAHVHGGDVDDQRWRFQWRSVTVTGPYAAAGDVALLIDVPHRHRHHLAQILPGTDAVAAHAVWPNLNLNLNPDPDPVEVRNDTANENDTANGSGTDAGGRDAALVCRVATQLVLRRDDRLAPAAFGTNVVSSLSAAAAVLTRPDVESVSLTVDAARITTAQRRARTRRITTIDRDRSLGGVIGQLREEFFGTAASSSSAGSSDGGVGRTLALRERDRVVDAVTETSPRVSFTVIAEATALSTERAAAAVDSVRAAVVATRDQRGGEVNVWKPVGRSVAGRWWTTPGTTRRLFGIVDATGQRCRWRPGHGSRNDRNTVPLAVLGHAAVPPTKAVTAARDNLAHSAGALAVAPHRKLPTWTLGCDDILAWGAVTDPSTGERRLVGPRLRDTNFTVRFAASGGGKTATNTVTFTGVTAAGAGGLFLDPHYDAINELRPHLEAHPGIASRLVNLEIGPGRACTETWNPFDISTRAEIEPAANLIVNSIATAQGWSGRTTGRIMSITRLGVQALLEAAVTLPADAKPTIFQLVDLTTDPEFRHAIASRLDPHTADYWLRRYDDLPDEASRPLTNMIDRLATAPAYRRLLGSPTSTINTRRWFDTKAVVLVGISAGDDLGQLLIALLLNDIHRAAQTRPLGRRDPWHLFCDEFQTYAPVVADIAHGIVTEDRKFGLRLHAFNQNPEDLPTSLLKSLVNNANHIAVGEVGASAAKTIAAELPGLPNPDTLITQPAYSYITRMSLTDRDHNTITTRPFRIDGLNPHWDLPQLPTNSEDANTDVDLNNDVDLNEMVLVSPTEHTAHIIDVIETAHAGAGGRSWPELGSSEGALS